MPTTTDYELYETLIFNKVGTHADRRLFPNINHLVPGCAGDVHVNLLMPGAQAGNHFHKETLEYFVSAGPGTLRLHLKRPEDGKKEVVEMIPASIDQLIGYRAKRGIAHLVENPQMHAVALVVLVDRDNPEDMHSFQVA